jgi:hypothetical protein
MRPIDLLKATVACGGIAYLVYSFPTFSQWLLIALLFLLWLSYLYSALFRLRRR